MLHRFADVTTTTLAFANQSAMFQALISCLLSQLHPAAKETPMSQLQQTVMQRMQQLQLPQPACPLEGDNEVQHAHTPLRLDLGQENVGHTPVSKHGKPSSSGNDATRKLHVAWSPVAMELRALSAKKQANSQARKQT